MVEKPSEQFPETIDNRAEISADCTDYKVLLGWSAGDLGDRLSLRMQSLDASQERDQDVHETCMFMTKTQAVQLATYLFQITGESAPTRHKPPLLDRLLGK
ncbi:hypothetical protein GRI38_03600 [Altererythrobacter aurantiacus]|uniref:Uncharacterized protein n=1 Tax=Parapontixanthobacter aurantiacus TaxID=1463599 RepID=A0A844ZDT7_9SPHN|nr:hypothetical protein [Parapontixanthobacter aurantiacus]MXO85110.1 hypothetical protein [Parapontixanthobacter aurantiacus]